MCSNESHEEVSAVPGHEYDCDCYVCETVREVDDLVQVPDDFAIFRHAKHPLYILQFMRVHDVDDVASIVPTRILLDARLLSEIGALMIQHSLTDAANTMLDDDAE